MNIQSSKTHVTLTDIPDDLRLETKAGDIIEISMRNNTFEINIKPQGCTIPPYGNWWRVNQAAGVFEQFTTNLKNTLNQ